MLVEHNYPWRHYTVDNFLQENVYKLLLRIRNNPKFSFVDSFGNGVNNPDLNSGFPTKKNLDIWNDGNLTNLIRQDVERHLSPLLPKNFFCIPDLVKCEPGYVYLPHVDHKAKHLSIVVYLHPLKSNGTILIKDNIHHQVEWQPNRALIMTNEPHMTHYYHNNTIYPRLTLNIYITLDSTISFRVAAPGNTI